MSRVNVSGVKKRFSEVLRKCVFVCEDDVSLPRQGTTPQNLKADISLHTSVEIIRVGSI
jgi:hypothetical protein